MLRAVAERLSRSDIVFYSLPLLMALLVAGTLAQAEMGLYAAQQKYFASFIAWVGPLPLPGGYLLLGLLSLNLTLKFLFFSEWKWRKSGIILTHLGTLVILIGGLLTALFAREGYMIITEGQAAPFVYDYHKRELAIFKGEQPFESLAHDRLVPGQTIETLPFTVTVLSSCKNCGIIRRDEAPDLFGDPVYRDLAVNMALSRKTEEKEHEANLSGITFRLEGLDDEQNGVYIAFEGMPRPITVSAGTQDYNLIFGKAQRRLPFAVYLEEFIKRDYPGTSKARDYISDVRILDEGTQWDARITMNAPLRYKGYTFYQSSFEQTPLAESTILSVVENKGRLFPYIGTGIIAFGLILHLILVLRRRPA